VRGLADRGGAGALASAFDLTLAGLMLRAEGQGERVSRAADNRLARSRDRLSAPPGVQPARSSVEIIKVEMPAKQRVTLPAASYAHIRQVLWVLTGALVLIDAGERYELRTGDGFGFGPPSDVTFANEGAAPVPTSSRWRGVDADDRDQDR
jgi:hypothetical protein